MELPASAALGRFVLLAEELDLARVAERSGLSAEALRAELHALEQSLGGARLTRTEGARLALSPAGRRLLPQARRALRELQRCVDLLAEEGPRSFALRLGTRFELGLSWLVPNLDRLAASREERLVHLSFGNGAELLRLLEQGELDALVTSTRLEDGAWEQETLHPESYVFVASPALVRQRPLRGAADAPDHVLLDTVPGLPLFRYLLDSLEESAAWPFERVHYLGTIAAIRERVLAGAGVAVLPRYFVAADLEAGRLRTLLSWLALPEDSFRLVWRRGAVLEAELRELARELRALPLS